MSSALNAKRATIIIGSISAAIVCASVAFRWYRKRRLTGRQKQLSKSQSSSSSASSPVKRRLSPSPSVEKKEKAAAVVVPVANSEETNGQSSAVSQSAIKSSSSSGQENEMTTTVVSSYSSAGESGRGGRRDYRHYRRNRDEMSPPAAAATAQQQMNGYCGGLDQSSNSQYSSASKTSSSQHIFNDPAVLEASVPATTMVNGIHHHQQQCDPTDAEIRGAQLAAEFSAKCQMSNNSATNYFNGHHQQQHRAVDVETNGFDGVHHHDAPSPLSIKGQCVESPSLSSDIHSEGSQDSGKGTSLGLTSSMSPVEELIEIPAVYEFEVPQDIVGLLIGKQGTTIKWLTQESQAHIVIRQHFYSDRHKICTLEGTREQINKCLRLIRRKFPPSRFPDLKLTPIIPPPVTASQTPVWDNVVQLHLPDAINCEVVVSSIVNAGHFFVQQPTHPTFSHLPRLDQYMVAVYNQMTGVPPLPRPLDIGVICAAPIQGGWYRAQTIEVDEESDEVLVRFVDYGGYSRIPASELRQIRSDFMTLPFQAIECYLAHVKPGKEGWSQEAAASFEKLSQGKLLEATVVGHATDNIPMVELYTPGQDLKDVMINRSLTENGHAEWTSSSN